MTRAMKRRNRRKARRMYLGGHPRQARSGNALISQTLRDLLPADPAIFERDLEDTRTYVYNNGTSPFFEGIAYELATGGQLTQEIVEQSARVAMARGGRP